MRHVSPARLWVLPNRHSLGLAAVLFAMWYAGASQNNSAAYLLCFILAAITAVSTLHTAANLRGLEVAADLIKPVFVGEEVAVPLTLTTDSRRRHLAILVSSAGTSQPARFVEVSAGKGTRTILRLPATKRGRFEELSVRLSTQFPLGFFTASRLETLRQTYFIYPQPLGNAPLPRELATARVGSEGVRAEGDDFGGVRAWRSGESQRHIDWKAAARGQPLLIKQWVGEAEEVVHLDWQKLPALDPEARLSQLTRWLLEAQSRGVSYSLAIPGFTAAATTGEGHLHACLRALAEFQNEPDATREA